MIAVLLDKVVKSISDTILIENESWLIRDVPICVATSEPVLQ